MKKMDDSVRFLKNVWALTRSYWQSEEKKKAYLLLFAIVALTLGVVFMLVQLNQWYNIFYSALQNYEKDKIFAELFHFSWLAFIYIILAVYAFYLQQILIINWRRWLTNQYIDEWLEHKTYYRLQMFGTATDNPDQRISEDVRMFVEYTLRFGIGILKAFTTFASFVVILYNLSGPLQFKVAGMDIHIPGYLVWTALLYSIAGTWLTYKVGNKLVGLNFVQQKYEADFRFAMMRMRENAESVAFYSGEGHEGSVFKKRFSLLLENFWNIIKKQKQLTWLNSWYSQIAIIFPLVVAMPRYLAKEITLGGLMQISSAFGRVQESLSYFVDMYSSIAEWQAVVERLTGFGLHMRQVKQESAQKDLQRRESVGADIIAREMDVVGALQVLVAVGRVRIEHVIVPVVIGNGRVMDIRKVPLVPVGPSGEGPVVVPEIRDGLSVGNGGLGKGSAPVARAVGLEGILRAAVVALVPVVSGIGIGFDAGTFGRVRVLCAGSGRKDGSQAQEHPPYSIGLHTCSFRKRQAVHGRAACKYTQISGNILCKRN